jgi:hypothetical protein
VRRILHQLIANITAESTIMLTARPGSTAQTISYEIHFHSVDSELRVEHPIRPLEFLDPTQFDRTRIIERLVTTAQAYLRPVNGQAGRTYHRNRQTARITWFCRAGRAYDRLTSSANSLNFFVWGGGSRRHDLKSARNR